MTVLCSNCGETLADDDYRCPTCDALAPPAPVDEVRPGRSVFDSSGEDSSEDDPADAWGVTASAPVVVDEAAGDGAATAPWAIPIRESASAPATKRDPVPPLLIGLASIAMLAGLMLLIGQVLDGGDGSGSATPSSSDVLGDQVVRDSPTTEPAVDTSDVDASSSTSSSTSSSSSSTTTSTSSTTSTTAPTSTTASTAAREYTGSAPRLSSSFGGGWVAQLTSVPVSSSSEQVDAAWSQARSYAPGAVLARSDDWAPLRPGFWVIVDDGPFSSADDVRAFCARIGHADRSDCLPRELTSRG